MAARDAEAARPMAVAAAAASAPRFLALRVAVGSECAPPRRGCRAPHTLAPRARSLPPPSFCAPPRLSGRRAPIDQRYTGGQAAGISPIGQYVMFLLPVFPLAVPPSPPPQALFATAPHTRGRGTSSLVEATLVEAGPKPGAAEYSKWPSGHEEKRKEENKPSRVR